jgi:hypothetical protein
MFRPQPLFSYFFVQQIRAKLSHKQSTLDHHEQPQYTQFSQRIHRERPLNFINKNVLDKTVFFYDITFEATFRHRLQHKTDVFVDLCVDGGKKGEKIQSCVISSACFTENETQCEHTKIILNVHSLRR